MITLASAFFTSGDELKARRILKQINMMSYNEEYSAEFGRALILLASLCLRDNKCDLAEELCKKRQKYNQSCPRAFYLLGVIKEKQQLYHDAATFFSKAWSIEKCKSLRSGYKLALCLSRGNFFLECIEACDTLLSFNPNFDTIRCLLNESIMYLRP